MNKVNKKKKDANVKAHTVKNHLWVFVNALIDNPAFDSQTKESLTTRQASFGSKCDVPESMLKDVEKSGIVEALLSWADFKQSKYLKKTDGTKTQRIRGIVKLEDANDAGGRNSEKCTLILTEGDSAKALAMAGLSVVGRDNYGVFPLRGKLLNVREASSKQIMENEEIRNIKKILGLQQNKEYTNVKSLRYGHLMIMPDQDHDGSHIKGLLINFIHSF
jgi:DNA topoisomerase-2